MGIYLEEANGSKDGNVCNSYCTSGHGMNGRIMPHNSNNNSNNNNNLGKNISNSNVNKMQLKSDRCQCSSANNGGSSGNPSCCKSAPGSPKNEQKSFPTGEIFSATEMTDHDASGQENERNSSASAPLSKSSHFNGSNKKEPSNNDEYQASENDSDENSSQSASTNFSRSRQKKFLKNFKHLPQFAEEVVLQRYSCALVGDILLQGHLYITKNYFAFYSNVFGYVTKLQIPIRSVLLLSKEKTAKIIPNAVGLSTAEGKHVFSSLLSRDSTLKFMTKVWKRALRNSDIGEDKILLTTCNNVPSHVLEAELDYEEEEEEEDDVVLLPDEESSDSEIHFDEHVRNPVVSPVIEPSSDYLMKRTSQTSGTIFYQAKATTPRPNGKASTPRPVIEDNYKNRNQWWKYPNLNLNEIIMAASKSTCLPLLIVTLLVFLLCSSIYLVFRIENLQKQVESRYLGPLSSTSYWSSFLSQESSDKVQKVLDTNVNQISLVRKSLEKLSKLLHRSPMEKDET